MSDTSVFELLGAWERTVEARIAVGARPAVAGSRAPRVVPAAAMLTPENCMDLFDARSLSTPVRELVRLETLDDSPLD